MGFRAWSFGLVYRVSVWVKACWVTGHRVKALGVIGYGV